MMISIIEKEETIMKLKLQRLMTFGLGILIVVTLDDSISNLANLR